MSDQTVLIDQFLSSVIGTIHPDEIFDSIIDTAVRLLSPDGLLLTIRDDVILSDIPLTFLIVTF